MTDPTTPAFTLPATTVAYLARLCDLTPDMAAALLAEALTASLGMVEPHRPASNGSRDLPLKIR